MGSGAAGKALTQYGQGVASNFAQQYTGGLASLAGLGQNATQATDQAGQNTANQIGSNQIYAGNAQAYGYGQEANAINQGLGGLSGAYGMWQGNQQQGGGGNMGGGWNSNPDGTINAGKYMYTLPSNP